MTAFTDYTSYKNELENPGQSVAFVSPATTGIAGRWYDGWTNMVPVGTAPTTAAVPARDVQHTMIQQNGGAGQLFIVGADVTTTGSGQYLICDRLSHQGGLSGTSAVEQTTNLPTAALTRYTSGVGVMAAITVYTQIGTTGTTVTVSYTNEGGTSGQISPAVVIGGTGFREVARAILIPLEVGDVGIRSVESVTLAATTGTAGNIGVTLFKPLYAIFNSTQAACPSVTNLISGNTAGGIPEVLDDACLFVMACPTLTNIAGNGTLYLAEN